jgi:hypothetical protein
LLTPKFAPLVRGSASRRVHRAAMMTLQCCAYELVEEGLQAHRRMKADAEWQSLEAKLAGNEIGWEAVRVVPLLATIDDSEDDPTCQAVREAAPDLSTLLPAGDADQQPRLAVGTLDLNYGANLPAEELRGTHPQVLRPESSPLVL